MADVDVDEGLPSSSLLEDILGAVPSEKRGARAKGDVWDECAIHEGDVLHE